MTDVPPAPDISAQRKAAWAALPALAAQSNILGPYVLILTSFVGAASGMMPAWMVQQMFAAGLLAWRAGAI